MTARPLPLVLAGALSTGACGSVGPSPATSAFPPPTAEAGPVQAGRSAEELEAIFWARADSAKMRFTDADARFVSGMIGHHAQALVMARLAPSHGASPPIRVLAGRIINAQNDEISVMETWLRDRGRTVPVVEISGIEMSVRGADHAMTMPGMLTREQLEELDAARGDDFDRLFLTYMIQHHEGAVTMVLDLFATDGAGQDEAVFKLASDIQVDQITEIERMKLMLQQRNPE